MVVTQSCNVTECRHRSSRRGRTATSFGPSSAGGNNASRTKASGSSRKTKTLSNRTTRPISLTPASKASPTRRTGSSRSNPRRKPPPKSNSTRSTITDDTVECAKLKRCFSTIVILYMWRICAWLSAVRLKVGLFTSRLRCGLCSKRSSRWSCWCLDRGCFWLARD